MSRRIAIIGAGVVGVALADQLVARGERDVLVLDKGPLFATGGSSSHAPGLVSRTSTSKFLSETAAATIDAFLSLTWEAGPALWPVGTLEVAYNDDRLAELWRRYGAAQSFGWQGRMIDADEAHALWPIIETDGLLGAYATTGEGLAVALRAVQAQAARAAEGGARFRGLTVVAQILTDDCRVRGVRTADGEDIDADVIVCCAGVWGPRIAAMVGLALPVLPMEHQYAITGPIAELADGAGREAMRPIVRHHDIGIYYRDYGDRVGIGSFHHKGLPVAAEDLDTHTRNTDASLAFAFTQEDFDEAWDRTCAFMPALRSATIEQRFNGVFGFTPDGYPLIGEHPDLAGLWVAESVWVTHSVGVAQIVADLVRGDAPVIDATPADLTRFDEAELTPAFVEARSTDQYVDVYVAHHPAEPHASARGLRWPPFAGRELDLDAVFVDVATWERPQWYGVNASLDAGRTLARDAWSSRHWSPIAVAEHLAVRDRAGLFDLTPLYRIEVAGPGAAAFLHRMAAGRVDRPAGAVTYTVLLDEHGGIVSDVTVARFEDERFVLGGNGPRDLAWLRAHAPTDGSVAIGRVHDERALAGLWGPAAREILQPLTDADLGNDAFPYMSAQRIDVAGVRVDAARISYAGELGWELSMPNREVVIVWDAIRERGGDHGLVVAGRAALATLRLEKGYRAWGTDMAREHAPIDAGLAFTVRTTDADFIGAAALTTREPARLALRCLALDGDQVAMGAEPVLVGDEPVGFVTSAGWGACVEQSLAMAWVRPELQPGHAVSVRYFDRVLDGRIGAEAPFDPSGARLRA
jgi:glycine cleavage system aminomethyltransferase T/glycine/D-amino acid oxidase-like deaminating enzyme